jgi:hypothetical protein
MNSDKNIQRIIPLQLSELLPLIQQCRGQGYRLVQMHATTLKPTAEQPVSEVEVNYSLSLEDPLDTLRVVTPADSMLPSISTYYPGAAFYENEIHDLFGISFSAMSLDFDGNFYRIAVKQPFAPEKIVKTEPAAEQAAEAVAKPAEPAAVPAEAAAQPAEAAAQPAEVAAVPAEVAAVPAEKEA